MWPPCVHIRARLIHEPKNDSSSDKGCPFVSNTFTANLRNVKKQDHKLKDARRDTWAHTSPPATVAHSLRSTSSIEW